MESLPAKKKNLPDISELYSDTDMVIKENHLAVLLNQEPKAEWLHEHPTATMKERQTDGTFKTVPLKYLPIGRVEWLLVRIFGKYRVEVKDVKMIANSTLTIVRLHVKDPITGEWDWNDGIGATPIQTDKDKGAIEWDFVKANGVQLAGPSSESYAIKDAAEKFGKIFGKDTSRKEQINYDSLLKEKVDYDWTRLTELRDFKKDGIAPEKLEGINRIIKDQEKTSFQKTDQYLKSL